MAGAIGSLTHLNYKTWANYREKKKTPGIQESLCLLVLHYRLRRERRGWGAHVYKPHSLVLAPTYRPRILIKLSILR